VPLFKDYAGEWLKGYVKGCCKNSTYIDYEIHLNKHLNPVFGCKPVDQIARRDIKQFIASKLAEGLSPKTVNNIRVTLSGVLSSAFEDELIPGNPAVRLGRMFKGKDLKEKINPLTKQETLLFLKSAQEHYPKYYPLFLLAVSTGLRQSEIIGLQPGDIDFNGMFIEVKRGIVKGRVETPKSGKSRRVDMSRQLAAVLKQHTVNTKEETLHNGWKQIPATLFYSESGNPLDPRNLVQRYFSKCLEKAGLRRIRFHDLRHTFASLHISQCESLAYVKEQLGHYSIQITVDIYGHLVPGANREAADRLLLVQQPATYPQPEAFQA
jgi:integrase